MPHLDVLWNASENRSHSIAILEAMAVGLPVIASDTPFNREFVIEGETGYLIPLGSRAGRAARARHTDRLFSDGGLYGKLAASSRNRAATYFDIHCLVREYIKVYQAVK
jgi:glycosyltransferase involved in cell wall biosynthesis